jgi:hypothetical protein
MFRHLQCHFQGYLPLYYKLNISSMLFHVVEHAFEYFRCLTFFVEYHLLCTYIIHIKYSFTYFMQIVCGCIYKHRMLNYAQPHF